MSHLLDLPDRAARYALAQRTEVADLDAYRALIADEFAAMAEFLVPGDVLEIGCGVGATAVHLARYGRLHLIDGTGWSRRQAGWWDSREPWNDMALTEEVLHLNGVADYRLYPIGTQDVPAVDNVVSLLSWGWHYPVDAYLAMVRRILWPGGRLVIDLRDGRPSERALLARHFDFVGEVQRHWRPGARTVWTPKETTYERPPAAPETPPEEVANLAVVLWKWGSAFSADHVNRMRGMLSRHLHMAHEVVCITDDARGIDSDIRIVPLWSDLRDAGKCTVRLKAFHPSMREVIGPRFAWIDLDCVIVDDVTPIFSRAEDFVISGVELPPQPYNGSIVMMDAGARPQVFETFDPARLARERRTLNYGGSDQAWIAICLGPGEATWVEKDGIFTYRDFIDPMPRMPQRPRREAMKGPRTNGALPEGSRIVVFNGVKYDPANTRCRQLSPWIGQHWR